jgi:signal transduction histidine kinase/ActR/RegA family two-component response regulator
MTAWSLLDERLDAVAMVGNQTLRLRLIIAVVCVVLLGVMTSPVTGAFWGAGYAAAETWANASSRRLLGGAPSDLARASYLGSVFANGLAWCAAAVLVWATGIAAYRLVALTVLAGNLIHAQCFCIQSPTALVVRSAPAAILWLVLPTLFAGLYGFQQFVVAVGLLLLLAYLGASAALSVKAAAELAEAKRQAIAANNAKSAFLAMMSHELRTPMNGVLGVTRALRATRLSPQQEAHVDTILKSGESLMSVLNDVLDISKIEAGRLDLEIAPFDILDTGRRVAMLWNEAAAAKGLDLVYDADPEMPAWVIGDITRVRQIMHNLMSNAIKFTQTGELRLSVKSAPTADGDGGVEFAVADTGIGISLEQQSRLFTPFSQADASTARKFGGTGLGLSICRQLTEIMGGEISARSVPGRGSVFRVWLPLPHTEAPLDTPEAITLHVLPGLRILVAEDNPINQAVARAILETTGATIEMAGDGKVALERLMAEDFDVVLMDVHMPEMDGIEAVSRIRAGMCGRADIPVIALTADAMMGEDKRLVGLGFDALQHKPVQPAALINAIVEVLNRQRDAAAAAEVA